VDEFHSFDSHAYGETVVCSVNNKDYLTCFVAVFDPLSLTSQLSRPNYAEEKFHQEEN
jgi:hypothetical protein